MRIAVLALSLLLAAAASADSRLSYVYQRGGGDSITRVSGSFENYKRLAKRFSGEYIWVRRDGREWLIRDAAVLAAARKAFEPMDALEPAMRDAEERLRPIEESYDEMEEKLDDITDELEDEAADATLEARMRETERHLRAIEKEMRAAEAAMEKVEAEMERREKIAEERFEKVVVEAIEGGKAQRVD